ncbi:MAG TPA: TetR/AcrR family transcriptional regulator [Acidimicrobiales bacterium]|nr:TetR/AcrR family transcriptional regulator [Acidimicrobiales bacterium]
MAAIMNDQRQLTVQGEKRKTQLLECAAELFAEHGYAETRVVDIVRAAGVAKGLFYWYFENKAALFTELVVANRERLRRAQFAAIDLSATPLQQIRQGAEASLLFMAERAPFFALLEVENVNRAFADVLRVGTDIHTADTKQLIEVGIERGAIRDDDAELLALGVVGAVGYYGHFHRTGRTTGPMNELAHFVGRFVVCSLAADEEIARQVLDPSTQEVATPGSSASNLATR